MNISDLVLDLQTKCIWVGTPERMAKSSVSPLPEKWTIPVIEIAGEGAYSNMSALRFTVLNRGVVAGPQVYLNDVFDEDGTTLLHSAGDPVFDTQGQQVVVPVELSETVLLQRQIKTPVADTFTAITYLETERAKGTWLRYVEDDQGPKRPDLKFFTIKAFVEDQTGVVEKRFLIAYDDAGQPFHTEIV